MPERRSTRQIRRRGRGNDASGALEGPPSSRSTLVRFAVVEIREFERVVGDNPSCSSGVPVSIGWNHGKTFTMNLEDFEKARPPRRSQMDLVLTRGERHRLLVEWGASGQDVIESIRMIIRVKNQRRQTVNNLGSYDRVEEVIENVMRGARKVICQSSSNTAALKLQEKSERAATMQQMQNLGQATSFTANETLTATSGNPSNGNRNKGQSQAKQQRGVDPKPPCEEVSVMENNFETCSNSDIDNKTPRTSSHDELPEEYPVGEKQGGGREPNNIASHPPDSTTMPSSDLYDDVDDMSNPQSHDHHQPTPTRREPAAAKLRTSIEPVVGGSVDI